MLVVSLLFLSVVGAPLAAPKNESNQGAMAAPSSSASANFDATRCRAIAELSAKSAPSFIQRDNGEWECTYMLEYLETGHVPSLFIQIRGTKPGEWASFRLKLNFGSKLSRQVLGARAANLVYSLIGERTPLRQLDAVLAEGREFELSFDTMTLKYKKERFDPSRFNFSGSQVSKCVEPCR